MKERLEGPRGRRQRVDLIRRQRLVAGNERLAEKLADIVDLRELNTGEVVIEQGGEDNDLYFILTGSCDIVINSKIIRTRVAGESVGEMAAVEPLQKRSATVRAREASVLAKLTETQLTEIAGEFPDIWRHLAQVLSKRLLERNQMVAARRDKIRVFVISTAENVKIVRALHNQFEHDEFATVPWNQGVFRIANYTIDDLEQQLDQCDFAVAIAHGEDRVRTRNKNWPAPRDNVVFELGLFMGRLGRSRAILMEPKGVGLKLPSDMAGLTTIRYDFVEGAPEKFAPACDKLREHIKKLGCIGQD
ncbi:TIR domain-containing protein [Pseudacidovorax sp. NFM-22]|uniref:TIR domain-containing protein n=1 Tax=Pseudacidovorax sp. NFM-22 TaxID=2744469 RepID=UPI001F21FAF8|nr:TIR domain-containing protein [Pseudacidovorax sp. NFM-22]